MKIAIKLSNLGCAHCASKIEAAIKRLPCVSGANLAFMTQRLTIEVADEDYDEVLKQAERIISRIEPRCKMSI